MIKDKIKDILKGKRISILGDSISTFDGYSNNSAYNKTLVSNATFYRFPFYVEDTYWMRLIKEYDMELCVNNSWSGAYLTKHFPNVGGDYSASLSPGVERVKFLANNNDIRPDVIILFMGINDLGVDVYAKQFKNEYCFILEQIKRLYGDVLVLCIGLPNILNERKEKAQKYNQVIKESISHFNQAIYVDLFADDEDVHRKNTLDGVHPNAEGMMRIFRAIEQSLQRIL